MYVSGDHALQETSEQFFYALDQQRTKGKGNGDVLYFSFSKWDTTLNTLKDMLATFVAQLMCHNPDLIQSVGYAMFVQLNEEHGWTDQDLMQ